MKHNTTKLRKNTRKDGRRAILNIGREFKESTHFSRETKRYCAVDTELVGSQILFKVSFVLIPSAAMQSVWGKTMRSRESFFGAKSYFFNRKYIRYLEIFPMHSVGQVR